MQPAPGQVTQLLRRMKTGESEAKSALGELIYGELRRIAAAKMWGERPDHTLTPTALANEAWLRLGDLDGGFENRSHFLAVASNAMRRVLIDHARSRSAAKRSGGMELDIEKIDIAAPESDEQLIELDNALADLAQIDPRAASVIEMRYFGGLTHEQIAQLHGVQRRTIDRDWKMARAWLLDRLSNNK